MGAIAESMLKYAQPLIEATDGSQEEMQRALSVAQMCWNIALLPEPEQEEMLVEIRSMLGMGEDEFTKFRESVIGPMILRHQDMFPNLSRKDSRTSAAPPSGRKKYPGTGRNEPCPCNSGKKYKRCCGR